MEDTAILRRGAGLVRGLDQERVLTVIIHGDASGTQHGPVERDLGPGRDCAAVLQIWDALDFFVVEQRDFARRSWRRAGFTLTVREVNVAPVLAPIGNQSTDADVQLTFVVSATDADQPAQTLTYSMDAGAPAGASFNTSTRTFSWTPTSGQAPSTNSVTFRVSDNGSPVQSDSEAILIVVRATNPTAPRFTSIQPAGAGQVTLTWTSIAGKDYRLESKDDLGLTNWTPGPIVTATGASTSTTVTATGAQRYYRVVQTN